ncbi:uncharacterized protein LDX57_010131 [Aspergillus melleus]|uniref:uncharacterized protein n=1 Tax=Aspergillus melleus TaxID=138277 RepID=UPI001E8DB271|nr:uncharacterized protein LDX57_010131 [Aspergillus melleus]KAH8432495.1 hypothetical protein LDX57_010131 [Aspergillus melleus]
MQLTSLLTLALASTAALAAPAAAPEAKDTQTLSKRGVETIYLSNCVTSGSAYNRSGMFYYPDGDQSQNGERPASGNYASVNGGNLVGWEGRSVSGTFGSGVTFTSSITPGSHAAFSWSGSGTNGYRSFNCYRDNERFLFNSASWGNCYSVYYCI